MASLLVKMVCFLLEWSGGPSAANVFAAFVEKCVISNCLLQIMAKRSVVPLVVGSCTI